MMINKKVFREYDIRGHAEKDFPNSILTDLGKAFAAFFLSRGVKSITLGEDCRLSSPRISQVLTEELLSSGINVIDIGVVPTPLLYFSVFHLGVDGGIMITGSHNPKDQNGFKIMLRESTLYGADLQEILSLYQEKKFYRGLGSFSKMDLKTSYIAKVKESFPQPLSVKVVVDSGNGTAGGIAAQTLRALGCTVTELFSELDGNFPNHHPDPTEPENLKVLIEEVRRQNTLLGIAFDGDADRIGVVDQTGRVIYGDELLVLYSRDLLESHPGATIISEVKASHRLFQDIARAGGKPILWKTGHSLIKAKMKEEKALLAGEMSGHMFFSDRYYGFDDAIYAAARLVEIIAKKQKTPAELLADLPITVTTPEIRKDCADEIKFAVVEQAKKILEEQNYTIETIDGIRIEFADGWGLVRPSNTQPVLVYRFEANSKERLEEIRRLVEGTVEASLQQLRS